MSPPARLVQEIADNRAVAFIGSGLSLAAGLPDWPGLLKELISEGRGNAILEPDYQELIEWARTSDYLMLADALMNLLGRDRLVQSLARRFNKATNPTGVHRALTTIPLAAYITTNYDTLLEDAWSAEKHERLQIYTNRGDGDLRDPFRSERPFLVKVHGDISSPSTLILGLGEFRHAIHDNRSYRMFLQDVFRRYTVLFLGYSLSDPDVLNMLDELVAIFGEVPGRHYALVDEDRISRLRGLAFDRNYGIEVIRYHKSAPNHPEVLAFVRSLHDAVVQEKRKQLASINVQVADDPSSRPFAQTLASFLRVDVVSPPASNRSSPASPAVRVAERPASAAVESPAEIAKARSTGTLRDYCLTNFGIAAWQTLEPWYERLASTPAGSLLLVNLDRESARDDLSRDVWSEFIQELVRIGASPDQPFAALQQAIEANRSRFLLRGKRLETQEPLCRYMRLRQFNMVAGIGALPGAAGREALQQVETEDSNAVQIGELLLGKPGGPSWCTTPSFAEGRDAKAIVRDLWDSELVEPLVEIRYAPDTLSGNDYLRVPTVIDMYSGRVEEANILKLAPGEGDWCWTVRVHEAPQWTPLARAGVHPVLKLAGVRAQTLQVRVII